MCFFLRFFILWAFLGKVASQNTGQKSDDAYLKPHQTIKNPKSNVDENKFPVEVKRK